MVALGLRGMLRCTVANVQGSPRRGVDPRPNQPGGVPMRSQRLTWHVLSTADCRGVSGYAWAFVIARLSVCLAAPASSVAEEPQWVPLVSDKAAITAPPEVIKRAFSEGIGGGDLAVNLRNGDLYVEGHGVLKSTDGGQTYSLLHDCFSYCGAFPLCMDLHADGKKIAVCGWCDLPGSSGSGYSLDGGKTWQPFASFDDPNSKLRGGLTGAALEPGDGRTVLARGYNYQTKNLFYSADLGQTWAALEKRARE